MKNRTEDESASRLRVGVVRRPHGVRGELRIASTTDVPEQRFRVGSKLGLGEHRYRIESARQLPNTDWLIKLEGLDSREATRPLLGKEVWIPRGGVELGPTEWFRDDLIGCRVISRGDGRELGRVREVVVLPSNDVLRIEAGGRERLLALTTDLELEVDLGARTILVTEPEEL